MRKSFSCFNRKCAFPLTVFKLRNKLKKKKNWLAVNRRKFDKEKNVNTVPFACCYKQRNIKLYSFSHTSKLKKFIVEYSRSSIAAWQHRPAQEDPPWATCYLPLITLKPSKNIGDCIQARVSPTFNSLSQYLTIENHYRWVMVASFCM